MMMMMMLGFTLVTKPVIHSESHYDLVIDGWTPTELQMFNRELMGLLGFTLCCEKIGHPWKSTELMILG
jgi:hypothetical protein